jgi:hypothetical protein
VPGVWTLQETLPFSKKRRFSLYWNIVARFWAGGPDELKAAPLNRICTLARKMGLREVIAEDALRRADVAEEIDRLRSALNTKGEVTAVSITFMATRRGRATDVAASIIGQVVIVTFPSETGPLSYVFEAVLRVPSRSSDGAVPLLNNYVMDRVSFPVELGGERFQIPGTYFCQPNGVTTTEISAAIKSTVMSIHGRGQDGWSTRRLPSTSSATSERLVEALKWADCAATIYSSEQTSRSVLDQEIWTVISSYIESGNPVLLVLSQRGMPDRILAVIGYTLNTDEWHPSGSNIMRQPDTHWFSSSQWVDHLIVQDPQLGPYFCLSRAWLAASIASNDDDALKLSFMIATARGDGVAVSPVVAEEVAGRQLKAWLRYLADAGTGTGRWWDYLVKSEDFIVLRTTLISRNDYRHHLEMLDKMSRKKSLASSTHEQKTVIDDFIDSLPEEVWMCEISLPQLYVGNRTKLGEVLIATGVRDPDGSFLGSRLPSQIFWRDEKGDFFVAPTGIDFHAPLLEASEHKNRW